jgi:hypothetical protein
MEDVYMGPGREVARRFFAWVLVNLLFVALSFLLMKPLDVPYDSAFTTILLQALVVGSLFTLSVIILSVKVNDEAFSRRMAASVIFHVSHLIEV